VGLPETTANLQWRFTGGLLMSSVV